MFSNHEQKGDRILVVDDTLDNLILIQTLLEAEGYQVVLAEDGETALAEIQQSPPDLILLDVMMPGIDGYEVTRQIRNNPTLPMIPILLITAHRKSSVVEGLDAGADDFIRKPMDIDELMARVRALLRLKHSIDEQENLSRQREDFVSRLTHDLRTPLVAMDRMLTLIHQGSFGSPSEDLQGAIESMTSSNRNLLQMVNTILEVYRHDAGRKSLVFSPCDIGNLIHDVMAELKPLALERGLVLLFEGSHGRSPDPSKAGAIATVMGDPLELRRVLTNIIGNAIKFTESGSITVRLLGATPVQPGQVMIEVEDTGAGIPPDDQAVLFERFRHGKHKRSGSGLGLYLSRRIVEAHRGTLEVRSQLGQGATFTICLPVSQDMILTTADQASTA